MLAESDITFRRVVVTDRDVLGKTVGELNLDDRFGVAVTRVTRADIEMSAVPGLRLQFGDMITSSDGRKISIKAADAVGNSAKELNETHFIPFFIGLVLGIALGTMPIAFPGLPATNPTRTRGRSAHRCAHSRSHRTNRTTGLAYADEYQSRFP